MEQYKFTLPIFSAAVAAVSASFELVLPWLGVMVVAVVLDYLTGMAAAVYVGELSSRTGIKGILKKLAYFAMVAVGIIADKIILSGGSVIGLSFNFKPMVGLLVVIWITLNELISILENLGRMDVPLPKFLNSIIKTLHSAVEEKSGHQE